MGMLGKEKSNLGKHLGSLLFGSSLHIVNYSNKNALCKLFPPGIFTEEHDWLYFSRTKRQRTRFNNSKEVTKQN